MSEIYSAPPEVEEQAEIAFSLFAFQLCREEVEEAGEIVEKILVNIDWGFMDFSQALLLLSGTFGDEDRHD